MARPGAAPGKVLKIAEQAIALRSEGRLAQALATLARALKLDPGNASLHNLRGVLLDESGDARGAASALRHAIGLDPSNADAHFNLGRLLERQGEFDAAESAWHEACVRRPGWAAAEQALGILLAGRGRTDAAIPRLEAALAADPTLIDAHLSLARIQLKRGDFADAMAHFAPVVQAQPDAATVLQFALATPLVYMDQDETLSHRARIEGNLAALARASFAEPVCPVSIGAPTFPLAYQGLPDRELMCRYASVMRRLAPPRALPPMDRTPRERPRIAFVSAFLRSHTIGRLYADVLARLDRSRFEIGVFLPAGRPDEITLSMLAPGETAVGLGTDLQAAIDTLHAWSADIVFFTDIGMDGMTYAIAMHRLAPVQLAGWGHPVTSGLDTIDGFVSSEGIEVEASAEDYHEPLLLLPCLQTSYRRSEIAPEPVTRPMLGLPESGALIACLQSDVKLHPDFDAALAGVLHQLPDARLLLLGEAQAPTTRQLQSRLASTLGPAALQRVHFLPPMPRARFLGVVALADLTLDTFPFGGGNTSLEALALGTPVVALTSTAMRGRVTAGIYRQMGLPELIASNLDDYIARAVRLASDPHHRAEVRQQCEERLDHLFDTDRPARALEELFTGLLAR